MTKEQEKAMKIRMELTEQELDVEQRLNSTLISEINSLSEISTRQWEIIQSLRREVILLQGRVAEMNEARKEGQEACSKEL